MCGWLILLSAKSARCSSGQLQSLPCATGAVQHGRQTVGRIEFHLGLNYVLEVNAATQPPAGVSCIVEPGRDLPDPMVVYDADQHASRVNTLPARIWRGDGCRFSGRYGGLTSPCAWRTSVREHDDMRKRHRYSPARPSRWSRWQYHSA